MDLPPSSSSSVSSCCAAAEDAAVDDVESSYNGDGQFGGSWHSSDDDSPPTRLRVHDSLLAEQRSLWNAWLNKRWAVADQAYNLRLLDEARLLFPLLADEVYQPPEFDDW